MTTVVLKSWGREEIIHNGEYCCKKLIYTQTIASSFHYHEKKHETFVVLSGKFQVRVSPWLYGIKEMVGVYWPGDFIVLPPGTRHRVRCLEPGVILEASTHDDPSDCVRLIPSE